ncbi:nuclear transport factor 2 family protein [Salinarimonas rosea]|uniref:nuclear transport factor 2 family protein n=1 Tax=Salinarimonas rosea TaxID=552063 RepID=UPI000424A9B5|nr:nuclear transport factor 2 family protein [Salinarimonas rosea]
MNDDAAWALEERFWLDGPSFYRETLHEGCVMAFPGMGLLRVPDILRSIEHAPRWSSVRMHDRILARAGDDVVVLGYGAEGRREGAEPYRCLCTSTYRADEGRWTLIQHQQTPVA